MSEIRSNGPMESALGYQTDDEGVGAVKVLSATILTSTATVRSPFTTVQGAWLQRRTSAAPTANTPVFHSCRYSGATIYINMWTAAFGAPSVAATWDLLAKGIY